MAQQISPAFNWTLIPLLIVAVAITLTIQKDRIEPDSEASIAPERADYFIRGAKLSTLGLDGKLLYQVQAREILHFPDRSAELTDMTLHYQGGSAGVWQLKAKQGRMPAGSNTFELEGDVIIRGKRPNEGLTQMRMSSVVLLPELGLLQSESEVSILEPGSEITAVGMEADIINDVLTLSKDVHVRYAW